jgi:hypothetical protein
MLAKNKEHSAAPSAMGDYVLRGLNGLRSNTHEHAFVQAPARLRANVPSNQSRVASYVLRRGVAGVERVQPTERQTHIGFAQQNCLHLKVLDFL